MLNFFKTYPARYWKWYLAGIIALLITNYVTVLIPREFEQAIDLLQTGAATSEGLLKILWTVIGLSLILLGFRTVSRILIFFPGRFVEFDIRNELYQHLINLDHNFYHKHKTGDLMSRLINDIQHLRLMVGFAALAFGNTAIVFGFALHQMFNINSTLAIYTLLPVPIVIGLILFVVRFYHKAVQANQAKLGTLTDNVVEIYSGINVIKSFGAERSFAEDFDKENQTYCSTSLKVALLRSIMFPMLAVIGSVGHFVLFYFGGPMIIANELSLGEFTAFSAYITLLAWPTAALAYMISVYQRGKVALERIQAIFSETPIIADGPQVKKDLKLKTSPSVQVKNLTIQFPKEDSPILKNINFEISPGSSLGIFGATGSGKSVLARALTRNIEASTGEILVNGHDIKDWPINSLRSGLSYVPQTSFLFSDSIKNNIAYSNTSSAEPDQALVENAANDAAIHGDILLFPKTYETLIGEKGVVLSGGQKNRLALARAFFKDHHMLVLDDVLSSVDHDTEKKLIDQLTKAKSNKTLVIISHRISALTNCDNIIVLEHGQITTSGSHKELKDKPGIYSDTWQYQSFLSAA